MTVHLSQAVSVAGQLLNDTTRRMRPGGLAAGLPAPSSDRSLVIVTGAGRSGTSAVARVLHESGIRMGSDLAAPSDVNPEGFYEDVALVRLHDRLLTELGMGDMRRQERWPWRSAVLAAARGYRKEMTELLAGAAGGWKDPRFAITLEAWLPLLSARPKLVVCLRSPRAYADSVVRGYGLVNRETAARQWAKHYRRLLDVIRDYELEATCVEYDALIERPAETVGALARFVERPLKPEYVDASLRRFVRPVPKEYARLYREVLALGGGVSPADAVDAEARSTGPTGTAKPLDREGGEAVAAYIQRVNEMEAGMRPAKAVWTLQVGLPDPKLARFERLGLSLTEAMEQTRAACETYVGVLKDVQEGLETLEPPRGFERFHELAQRDANLERLVAELMLAAAQGEKPDRKMLREAVRSWRRFGRSAASEKAEQRRRREYARALEESGYAAAGRPGAGE